MMRESVTFFFLNAAGSSIREWLKHSALPSAALFLRFT